MGALVDALATLLERLSIEQVILSRPRLVETSVSVLSANIPIRLASSTY